MMMMSIWLQGCNLFCNLFFRCSLLILLSQDYLRLGTVRFVHTHVHLLISVSLFPDYVDIGEVVSELESNYKFWKDASSSEPAADV